MGFVAVLLLLTAVIGAALARWTMVHPLLIGLAVGLPGGAIALLVAGAAMSEAALGAFVGWLRRKHIERIA